MNKISKKYMNQQKKMIKNLENKNFMEKYSIFMVHSQILEFELKKELITKFKYDEEVLEKYTLGRVILKLKKKGLNLLLSKLLDELLSYRNKFAHSFFVDYSINASYGFSVLKTEEDLTKGLISSIQTLLYYFYLKEIKKGLFSKKNIKYKYGILKIYIKGKREVFDYFIKEKRKENKITKVILEKINSNKNNKLKTLSVDDYNLEDSFLKAKTDNGEDIEIMVLI